MVQSIERGVVGIQGVRSESIDQDIQELEKLAKIIGNPENILMDTGNFRPLALLWCISNPYKSNQELNLYIQDFVNYLLDHEFTGIDKGDITIFFTSLSPYFSQPEKLQKMFDTSIKILTARSLHQVIS